MKYKIKVTPTVTTKKISKNNSGKKQGIKIVHYYYMTILKIKFKPKPTIKR